MENSLLDTWAIFSSNLNGHAIASPSSYTRWSVCPGSVYYTLTQPKKENEDATQGTIAHYVAAYILDDYLVFKDKQEAIKIIERLEKDKCFYKTDNGSIRKGYKNLNLSGQKIVEDVKEHEKLTFLEQRTIENIKAYVLSIIAFIESLPFKDDWVFKVEEKTIEQFYYAEPNTIVSELYSVRAYGTMDFVAWNHKTKEGYVVDFKNGNLYVPQEDNPQLLFYVINSFDFFCIDDDDTIEDWKLYYAIYQPSINETLQFSKVKEGQDETFKEEYASKARKIIEALVTKDKLNDQEWISRYLNPDEKACQFCVMKKRNCPVFSKAVNAVTVPKDITLLSDEEVYDHYRKLQLLANYKEVVYEEVASRVKRGSSIPLKFIKGSSRKKYLNKAQLKEALKKLEKKYPGISQKIYEESTVNLTDLKTDLKKERLTEEQIKEIVGSVTTVTEGEPKLVSSSDKRPEYIFVESLPDLDSDD